MRLNHLSVAETGMVVVGWSLCIFLCLRGPGTVYVMFVNHFYYRELLKNVAADSRTAGAIQYVACTAVLQILMVSSPLTAYARNYRRIAVAA